MGFKSQLIWFVKAFKAYKIKKIRHLRRTLRTDSFTIPDTISGIFAILDKGAGKNLGKNVCDMAQ